MRSLAGARVLVLRPERQMDDLLAILSEHGATAVPVPAIEIVPGRAADIDAGLAAVATASWTVFTGANGVEIVAARARRTGRPLRPRAVAAIGSGTARALGRHGVDVDWTPARFTTRALAHDLPARPGDRVVVFRAAIADRTLDRILTARGIDLDRIDAYDTRAVNTDKIRAAVADGVDAVIVTSASIATAFAEAVRGVTWHPAVVSIGPATSAAARRAHLAVAAEATEHTTMGTVRALAALLEDRPVSWTGRVLP